MKPEILAVFRELQNTGFFDWRLNATFITLLPKIEGAKEVTDYRPISLLNGIYKLIGNPLALRLKGVLNDLVMEFQCGGMLGRQLHEGVLITNELIETRLKEKKLGLICKIDFEGIRYSRMVFHG